MSKKPIYWIIVANRVYDVSDDVIVREVKCPKCGHCETFTNGLAPNICYVCEEERIMPEV